MAGPAAAVEDPDRPQLVGRQADPGGRDTGGTRARTGDSAVTWPPFPLYTYAGDAAPGEVKGGGVGGNWHVATPA